MYRATCRQILYVDLVTDCPCTGVGNILSRKCIRVSTGILLAGYGTIPAGSGKSLLAVRIVFLDRVQLPHILMHVSENRLKIHI